jgi:hypothetical protein
MECTGRVTPLNGIISSCLSTGANTFTGIKIRNIRTMQKFCLAVGIEKQFSIKISIKLYNFECTVSAVVQAMSMKAFKDNDIINYFQTLFL